MTTNDMIKFREREYSDSYARDPKIRDLIKYLDKVRETNFGISDELPEDSISVTYDSSDRLVIYIPLELNELQYDLEDYLIGSKPRIRFSSSTKRDLIEYSIKQDLNPRDTLNLVRSVIKSAGYIVLVPRKFR